MSPETHPENEHNIQREQQRLDELDTKRDSTIDIGEEREQLTQTYIKRVNDVQGHIRDLQKKIDVQKDMRAPHWQRLESVCFDVQGKLLEQLSAIDEENISRDVAVFNGAIDEFLATLKSAEAYSEGEVVTPEKPLLTFLGASISMLRSKRESKIDERSHVQDELQDIQEAIRKDTEALTTHARRGDREHQPIIVERLTRHQEELTQVEQQLAVTSQSVTMLDIQITALQAQKEQEQGNTWEADRLLIKLKERFGSALSAMHPGLWKKVGEAEQRLLFAEALSDFEQSLLRNKGNALQIAVEQQRRASIGEVDFLDQYRGYGLSLRKESPRIETSLRRRPSRVPFGQSLAFGQLVPSQRNSLLQLQLQPEIQLGTMRDGEVIVLQVDAENENEVQRPLLIAFRDKNGVVRLQDGSEVQQPMEIRPSTVGGMKSVYLSPEAQQMFENTPYGYRIALRNFPQRVAVQSWNAPSVRLLTTNDLAYVGTHEGDLFVKDGKEQLLTITNIGDLEKQREEQSRDVLRALDRDPSVQTIVGKTSAMQLHLQSIGELLSSGTAKEAEKAAEYVEYARSQARPLLALLNDPQLKGQLQAVKQQLRTLERTQFGFALGGIEREIAERIDAIDDMVAVLENPDIRRMCEMILDKSKFHPDTWAQWWKTEGVKFLAAIVVATAAIVTIVATFGAATPLWAIAAAGAAGGIIGSELAAEGVHLSYHVFDEDVRSGNATYSDRSLLGKYFEGQKVIDPVTGKERDMSFLFDVANPYAKQFFVNFAITFATLGAGRWAAGKINLLAQNTKWIQTMTQNGGFQRMSQSLGRIKAGFESIADKSLARKIVMESLQEIGEETAEAGIQQGLNRIDARLGMLAGFLVVTGQGIRLRPRVRGFAVDVPATASVEQAQEALRAQLEAEGHNAEIEGSTMMVTMWNGEKMEVEFLQVAESSNGDQEAISSEGDSERVRNDVSEVLNQSEADHEEGITRAQEYFTSIGLTIGGDGLIEVPSDPETLKKLREWHKETSDGAIQMPDKDIFYKKVLLAASLWRQQEGAEIRYLFGKGAGVEIALQGEITGQEKRTSVPQYRTHSDFECYDVKYEEGQSYSPAFRAVFGGQEIYPPTKTKGLENIPPTLLDETSEKVRIGDVEVLVPELELLFLDKYLASEATPRAEGNDALLLAKMYKLDRGKLLNYYNEFSVKPSIENLTKPSEALTGYCDAVARKFQNVRKRMQGADKQSIIQAVNDDVSGKKQIRPDIRYSGIELKYWENLSPSDVDENGNLTESARDTIRQRIQQDYDASVQAFKDRPRRFAEFLDGIEAEFESPEGNEQQGHRGAEIYTAEDVRNARKKVELLPKEQVINSGYDKYEYNLGGKTAVLYCAKGSREIEIFEQNLVNALIIQQRFAEQMGVEKNAYRSLHLKRNDSGELMTYWGDSFNLNAYKVDLKSVENASDQEKAVYFAGQIFHEVMHDGDSIIKTETDVFRGGESIGEITSIAGQTVLCLSEGYFGLYTYDTGRVGIGMRVIMEGQAQDLDYYTATAVVADVIHKRLADTFPEYADGLGNLDSMTACKEICKRVPSERKVELENTLKDAVVDSANRESVATAKERIATKAKSIVERGASLAKAAYEAQSAEEKSDAVQSLKEFMKSEYVFPKARFLIAGELLGRTITEEEWKALLRAHNKPGVIDELSPSELTGKAKELRSESSISKEERRLLIETGLAGSSSKPMWGLPSPDRENTRREKPKKSIAGVVTVDQAVEALHEQTDTERPSSLVEATEDAPLMHYTMTGNVFQILRFGIQSNNFKNRLNEQRGRDGKAEELAKKMNGLRVKQGGSYQGKDGISLSQFHESMFANSDNLLLLIDPTIPTYGSTKTERDSSTGYGHGIPIQTIEGGYEVGNPTAYSDEVIGINIIPPSHLRAIVIGKNESILRGLNRTVHENTKLYVQQRSRNEHVAEDVLATPRLLAEWVSSEVMEARINELQKRMPEMSSNDIAKEVNAIQRELIAEFTGEERATEEGLRKAIEDKFGIRIFGKDSTEYQKWQQNKDER